MVYKNAFEYFVNNNEIIVVKGVDSNITELEIPRLINRFPVVAIENSAFKGFEKLRTVHLPDTLRFIDAFAFEACSQLEDVSCLCEEIELGHASFRNCVNLESFRASKIISLNRLVFADCVKLRVFQGEINKVGYKTFRNCKSLQTSIIFAEHVYRLHGAAFDGCDNIPCLVFNGTIDIVDAISNDTFFNTKILCYPECCLSSLAYVGVNVDTNCGEILPF